MFSLRITMIDLIIVLHQSVFVQAMLKDFSVDNYGLPPEPPGFMEELVWQTEARKLTMEMSQNDYFEPWFPFPG